MKKFLVTLLTVFFTLSVCLLCACENPDNGGNGGGDHTCSFKTEWTTDETHHWHDCEDSTCTLVSDKAEHSWEDSDTCVCGKEKPVTPDNPDNPDTPDNPENPDNPDTPNNPDEPSKPSIEVSDEQWAASLLEEKFSNVSFTYSGVTYGYPQTVIVKVDGDELYEDVTIQSVASRERYIFGEESKTHKNVYLNMFKSLLYEKDSYEYNEEEKSYFLAKTTESKTEYDEYYVVIKTTNSTVKFNSDGLLMSLTTTIQEDMYYYPETFHASVTTETSFEFYDYGTTVITPITLDRTIPDLQYGEMTEEQFTTALSQIPDGTITTTNKRKVGNIYTNDDLILKISGNKLADNYDSFYEIVGDKYYNYYYSNQDESYIRDEISEDHFYYLVSLRVYLDLYNSLTYDEETGLYVADEFYYEEDNQTYKNFKLGFVDGKIYYFSYEYEEAYFDGSYIDTSYVLNEAYWNYDPVEVTLPEDFIIQE